MSSEAATRSRMAPDDRRRRIVEAAAELYTRRGYDEVSTTELARVAGISRGLLNHYFPTKRALYLAALRRFLDMPELPLPAFSEGATVEDRVYESVHAWLDQIEKGPAAWLAVAGLAGHPDDDVTRLLDKTIDHTADRICELTGLSSVRDDPAVRTALHGYAGLVVSVSRKWLQEGQIDRDGVERLFTGVLIDLVRVRIPALLGR